MTDQDLELELNKAGTRLGDPPSSVDNLLGILDELLVMVDTCQAATFFNQKDTIYKLLRLFLLFRVHSNVVAVLQLLVCKFTFRSLEFLKVITPRSSATAPRTPASLRAPLPQRPLIRDTPCRSSVHSLLSCRSSLLGRSVNSLSSFSTVGRQPHILTLSAESQTSKGKEPALGDFLPLSSPQTLKRALEIFNEMLIEYFGRLRCRATAPLMVVQVVTGTNAG
ncbi:hypothetical protein Syun_023318 [Stephania yunnanensis]|uniref:Uncharacterized protein n=1 Tax=Stephania yunnanensis TaxID=152371 RepID=A0AAP0I266_9MAGN